MVDMQKPFAPSCERNQTAILPHLLHYLADARSLLEIGSGTGQHAVFFAQALPQILWQPSERPNALAGIELWRQEAGLANISPAIALDVNTAWPSASYDAVFTANTLHIMSETEVQRFFQGLGTVLESNGLLIVYGPFNENGDFSSESNRQFDGWLKARNAHSGIRDIAWIDSLANEAGLERQANHAMPANNRLVIWKKS
jgi:cyclopropane fatty-acyl-phospholipid synthase-like methyltransferase